MTDPEPDPACIVTNGHAPAAISTSPEAEAFAAHLAASVPAFCSPASPHYPAFERKLFETERDANAGLITFDEYLKRHAEAIGAFVLAEFCTAILHEVFDPILTSVVTLAKEQSKKISRADDRARSKIPACSESPPANREAPALGLSAP